MNRIEFMPSEITKNKVFTCALNEIDSKIGELNKLLDDGWLVANQSQINDTYVVLLKQVGEPRKVFYVDVSGLGPEKVMDALDEARKACERAAGEADFFVPVRK